MEYTKTSDILLCIDSDGCVMDAMDIKHIRAFGPALVEEWGLQEFRDEILHRWNVINLYSLTRGINRFKGLITILREIDSDHSKIEDIDSIENWVKTTSELSESSLLREIEKHSDAGLKKALSWSKKVNQIIRAIPEDDILPFDGAKEVLEKLSQTCDIAVVSNANREAVVGEWERHGFMPYAKVIFAQDAGSKSECIKRLISYGYDKSKCIMVGDAKGDMDAAIKNEIFFYPVKVRKEKKSWAGFEAVVERLKAGTLDQDMQEQFIREFMENLC